MPEEIHIRINSEGDIKSHVQGVKGKHCVDLLKDLENIGHVTDSQTTSEFYEVNQVNQEQRMWGGHCG